VVEKELEVQNENCEQTLYDYFGGYFNRISFVEFIFIIIYFSIELSAFSNIEEFLFRLLKELI